MSGDDNNESAFNNDDEFSEFDDLLSRVVFDGDDLSSPDVFRDLVVSNDDDECFSLHVLPVVLGLLQAWPLLCAPWH